MDILAILLAGALGGAVRSLFGWAKSDEPFDPTKTGKSLIRGIIGGIVISQGLGLDIFGAFFAAIGSDVLISEGYKALNKPSEN